MELTLLTLPCSNNTIKNQYFPRNRFDISKEHNVTKEELLYTLIISIFTLQFIKVININCFLKTEIF